MQIDNKMCDLSILILKLTRVSVYVQKTMDSDDIIISFKNFRINNQIDLKCDYL